MGLLVASIALEMPPNRLALLAQPAPRATGETYELSCAGVAVRCTLASFPSTSKLAALAAAAPMPPPMPPPTEPLCEAIAPMSAEGLGRVLTALLLEQKILLYSRRACRLTAAATALTSLCFPMLWSNTCCASLYIPIYTPPYIHLAMLPDAVEPHVLCPSARPALHAPRARLRSLPLCSAVSWLTNSHPAHTSSHAVPPPHRPQVCAAAAAFARSRHGGTLPVRPRHPAARPAQPSGARRAAAAAAAAAAALAALALIGLEDGRGHDRRRRGHRRATRLPG